MEIDIGRALEIITAWPASGSESRATKPIGCPAEGFSISFALVRSPSMRRYCAHTRGTIETRGAFNPRPHNRHGLCANNAARGERRKNSSANGERNVTSLRSSMPLPGDGDGDGSVMVKPFSTATLTLHAANEAAPH